MVVHGGARLSRVAAAEERVMVLERDDVGFRISRERERYDGGAEVEMWWFGGWLLL